MTHNGHVRMKKKEFVQEHKHLVKTLKHGSKSERAEEAREQAGELRGMEPDSDADDDMMAQIMRKAGGRK